MIYATIRYHDVQKIKVFSPEQWARFCQLWPSARSRESPDHFYGSERQRIMVDEAAALETELGIMVEVEGFDGTMITKMKDRYENPDRPPWDSPPASHLVDGRAVQIAIPDLGLLSIEEVEVLDDACTDELRRYLSEGWRILAVCPPNAARRPDYILGRRKQPA